MGLFGQLERIAGHVARLGGRRDLATEGEARLASDDAQLEAISDRFGPRPTTSAIGADLTA